MFLCLLKLTLSLITFNLHMLEECIITSIECLYCYFYVYLNVLHLCMLLWNLPMIYVVMESSYFHSTYVLYFYCF